MLIFVSDHEVLFALFQNYVNIQFLVQILNYYYFIPKV